MSLNIHLRMAFPGLVLALACLLPIPAHSQSSPGITLDPPTGLDLQAHTVRSNGEALPPAPANFRRLGESTVGQLADLHTITLRFHQTTRVTAISVTKDFKVEQGGSCVEGNVYAKDTTCRLLVRFTPQGPGNRLGKLNISQTGSATPYAFGLGGYGYAPIVTFIPSIITTVTGSYPSNVGLLSGAQNLTVDGSDTLWVADTNNNLIRNLDAAGNFKTLASGYSAPWGIAVDTFGEAYFSRPAANALHEIYDYGPVVQINGAGTGSCPASTPCILSSHVVTAPGELSMDTYNRMFFIEASSGGALSTVQPPPASLIFLYDPFPFQTTPPSAMAVDSGDNLYSLWSNSGTCSIIQQTLYNAENASVSFNKIAGGHFCGFAGDGGLAGNAEIGNKIGQIAFDAAGDLYFTDTANQRVRRIDYSTGIIRTIAGDGVAGYTGDKGGATAAKLSSPTGVGVDSQGQVYIISSATSGQVIRKVTTTGIRNFASTPTGTPSAASTIVVTNTGNSTLQVTSTGFTGANPTDFSVDPLTTSCVLTPGAILYSGQSCQIGFIFTPTAVGSRSANFVMLDNTIDFSNMVTFNGVGTLPTATFKITSPTNGSSFTSGTAVPFKVSVTSTSGPAPGGTVQFKVDGANFGAAVALSAGVASTSVTGLTQTTHTLSATYSGDTNYAAGGPISVSIGVTAKAPPAVTLQPLVSAQNSCGPGLHSFEVVVTSPSGSLPTGTIDLMAGANKVASASLSGGKTALNSAMLAPGTYLFTAHYNGDTRNSPAVSTPLKETIFDGPCLAHNPVR